MTIPPGPRTLGPDASDLLLRTSREGVAGALGHDLTLIFGSWSATIEVGATPAEAAVTATVDLTSLNVREGRGGVKPLTDADRRDILKNAAKALGSQQHPTATFDSTEVEGDWGNGRVRGILVLHGLTAPIELTVTATDPGSYRATGTITQTEFGIKPYSAMLGALRIADQVEMEIVANL